MTAGFRETFNDWLEQRLSAELYVNPQSPEQARQLLDWLPQQAQVAAVLPSWQVALQVQGWPADLYGVIDHPSYRQHWPLLESDGAEPWAQLASRTP